MAFLTGGLAGIMAAYPPSEAETVGTLTSPRPGSGSGAAPPLARSRLGLAAGPSEPLVLRPAGWLDLVGVDILMTCVVVAVGDLPVWESSDVEQTEVEGVVPWGSVGIIGSGTALTHRDALLLLELVSQLGITRWSVALAVVLVDLKIIGPFAAAQPRLWRVFCEQLLSRPELYFLHEVVGALAAAGDDRSGQQQSEALDQQLLATSAHGQQGHRQGGAAAAGLNSSGLSVRVPRVMGAASSQEP
eukprot:gene9133-9301_t